MDCSDYPPVVFIETNLGTRLAIPASPDITVDDFKGEVERTHLNCFPELGNIMVEAMMVKQKLHSYHLPGSLPLKYAFVGSNDTWFLQTRVVLSNTRAHVESSKYGEADSIERGGRVRSSSEKRMKHKRKKAKVHRFPWLKIPIASCLLRKRKRRQGPKQRCLIENETFCQFDTENETFCQFDTEAKVDWIEESDDNVIAGATGEESDLVSGIIKKYFSDCDEIATHVGNRLLLASNNLRLTPSNRQSILSLCRHNNEESPFYTARMLAFEMADDDT